MVKIIAEIGINHNGDIKIAKKLIDIAVFAGCDLVKFQKRTVEDVYSTVELDKERVSPFGTTNREQKQGLEFGIKEYSIIDEYCKSKNIEWFASAWDIKSFEFLKQFDCKYNKIASAMLGCIPLIEAIAKDNKYTFISTGMSTIKEIDIVVEIFRWYGCPFELMHCTSTYPMNIKDANLNAIQTLRDEFDCDVGYSGHDTGLIISCAAVALGATSIERHITIDRSMYGSDQAASVEPIGLYKLVQYIRTIEQAMGDGVKDIIEAEFLIRNKLRYYENSSDSI